MNSFDVTVLREPNYAVLRTDGYINKPGAERIGEEIERLINLGYRRFILNLEQSPIINSQGLAKLIAIIERMMDIQGVLVFSNVAEFSAEGMEIMGLTQYVRVLRTEEEARRLIEQTKPHEPGHFQSAGSV